jgi:Holliday junction resolvase
MSGKAPGAKGKRFERSIVTLLRQHGLDARRVPLSGAARGFKGDVHIKRLERTFILEAKSRARLGFIYESLGENDFLAIKQDRSDPLVVLRLEQLVEFLK